MSMPADISGSAVQDFDLKAIAAELRDSPEYESNGRSARTLAKTPEMNILLGVVNDGVQLDEHVAPGSVTLTVIEGRIAFVSDGGERELGAGAAIVFAGGVPHSVRGIEAAAFLLAIAKAEISH